MDTIQTFFQNNPGPWFAFFGATPEGCSIQESTFGYMGAKIFEIEIEENFMCFSSDNAQMTFHLEAIKDVEIQKVNELNVLTFNYTNAIVLYEPLENSRTWFVTVECAREQD